MFKKVVTLLLALMLLGQLPLSALAAQTVGQAPAPSAHITTGTGYWETPMDINNVKAVWDMLMAPSPW